MVACFVNIVRCLLRHRCGSREGEGVAEVEVVRGLQLHKFVNLIESFLNIKR